MSANPSHHVMPDRRAPLRTAITPAAVSKCTTVFTLTAAPPVLAWRRVPTPPMRITRCFLCWLCLAASRARGTQVRPCDPATPAIDTIVIQSAGVAEGDGPLDRVMATVHSTTRASVIRRTLLVHPGECYDAARVAESERALWSLNVFRAVHVDTTRLPPDQRLALRVTTADGWSTRPVADYARAGAVTSWEAGFFEQNFLGTATQLLASWRATPDRSGLTAQYYNPHFLSPGAILFAYHAQLSNGRYSAWVIGVPFRETAARTSVTFEGEATAEHFLAYGPAGPATALPGGPHGQAVRLRLNTAFAPVASSRGYVRFWTALRWRRESYAPADTTPFQTARYLAAGAGVDLGQVRYRAARRVNTFGRQEYVDLSHVVHFGVWAAPRAWGYAAERAGVGLEARWQAAVATPRGYALLRLEGAGLYAATALDSAHFRGRLTVVVQPAARHTLIVHGDVARMFGARPPGVIDLWLERRGPRLFPPHAFLAPRTWWVAVEHRLLVSESVAGLVGAGVAPFFDYAQAWWPPRLSWPGVPAYSAGGNAGVALRLAPLRMATGDVTEVAVGRRFGSGFAPNGWVVGIRKALVF